MKERQRWQPEEDALLRAYVKQYGPREWNLVSRRMGRTLDRDAKSCLERWKNYLKPGIKKGSLTEEEQALVISLQAKYGNKWKKIAAEVPGRTAKRLGKWWEVFKEKQLKQKRKERQLIETSSRDSGQYDHILDTFAEKYVQKKISLANLPSLLITTGSPPPLLSLSGRAGSFHDNYSENYKPPAIVTPKFSIPQMENNSGSIGMSLCDIKGKVMVSAEIGPQLTLESLGGSSSMPDPRLALHCSGSAMELDLIPSSLGNTSFADTTSSLPPWMSSVPSIQASSLGLSDTRVMASAFRSDRGAQFLSKGIHHGSSPSVSLSLSPTSSDLIVSSGSASPASEVVAPRLWLQDLNGTSGGLTMETKVNFPWCSSEKQLGPLSIDPNVGRPTLDSLISHQLPTFFQCCKDLEEGRQSWFMHKKEATWRLSRLEQQIESEKARKRKEKIEEIAAKIRALREEEIAYLDKLESECKEQLSSLQKEAEMKEAKLIESWQTKHLQLTNFVEHILFQNSDVQRLAKKDTN